MAYVTGSASSFTDLLTGIRSACTANGWTLAGNVLSKGTNFLRTQVVGTTIEFLGGTGIDGSNNLTGAGPSVVRITSGVAGISITFPVTYEVHLNAAPDEVYVVVNYNINDYQWAAWGQSDVAGVGGTGMWYAAACVANNVINQWIGGPAGASVGSQQLMYGLFYNDVSGQQVNGQNSFIHNGVDVTGWSPPDNVTPTPWSWSALRPLYAILPSQWNDETVLLPMPVYKPRSTGNKVSLLADLRHIRVCRIDFHDPGDIVALGPDSWKVYPWYRKSIVNRDGNTGSPLTHSGTMGFAVRYTGP